MSTILRTGLGSDRRRSFFDTKKVLDALGPAEARALSQGGAYVRQRAMTSIRQRKKASRPGFPPSSHSGRLRGSSGVQGPKGIQFEYNERSHSVVIGPVLLHQVNYLGDGQPYQGTVPHVLEFGGKIGLREVQIHGRWMRANLRRQTKEADLLTRIRWVRIDKRPFMGPALEYELPRLPQSFQGMLKTS